VRFRARPWRSGSSPEGGGNCEAGGDKEKLASGHGTKEKSAI
jgi:hypothetical protein